MDSQPVVGECPQTVLEDQGIDGPGLSASREQGGGLDEEHCFLPSPVGDVDRRCVVGGGELGEGRETKDLGIRNVDKFRRKNNGYIKIYHK